MKTLPKVLLGLGGCALLAVFVAAGGVWWFWDRYGTTIVEGGRVAIEEGKKEGADLDEAGCLAVAVERHRAEGKADLASSIRNTVRLRGCLETSRLTDDFCQEAPTEHEVVRAAMWVSGRCTSLGFTDPYCSSLFQRIPEYCASPERRAKVERP